MKSVPHLHYVEPFAGGLAVLFARDPNRNWYEGSPDYSGQARHRGSSEVANDLHGRLTNFYQVLAAPDLFESFHRRIEVLPFSEKLWRESHEMDNDPVIDAVRFFVLCRQSHGGKMKSFAGVSRTRTRGGQNEQINAWMGAVQGLLLIHQRLQRVLILNDTAINVIQREDGPTTMLYNDPPYPHQTRTATNDYEHEMSDRDHEELLDVLRQCQSKVIISGYANPLYDRHLMEWNVVDHSVPNSASNAKTKRQMTERIWTNF